LKFGPFRPGKTQTELLLVLQSPLGPTGCPLQFSLFQRALSILDEETLRRRYQVGALSLEGFSDTWSSIAAHFHNQAQSFSHLSRWEPRIEGRHLHTLESVIWDAFNKYLYCLCSSETLGGRTDDEEVYRFQFRDIRLTGTECLNIAGWGKTCGNSPGDFLCISIS